MAGEQGAWRCAEGGATPLAAPLPEPPPAVEPGPTIVPLPDLANDPTLGVSTVDALLPAPQPVAPARADLFTLKIASVSAPDEIPDFVESYGLDPSLVRFMPIIEGDNTRQLILWGRFVSRAQAARAVVAMPAAVQAIRPQIAEVAGLAGPIRNYARLTETPAATAVVQPPTRPEPQPEPEPEPTEAVALAPAVTPAAPAAAPSESEPLVLAANEPAAESETPPALESREDASDPAPADPEPEESEKLESIELSIQDPKPTVLQPALEPEPEPETGSEPVSTPARSPEPAARQPAEAAAPAAEDPTPASRQMTPPPPQERPPGRPVVRARVLTATAFLTLPPDGYGIQLTSLSSRRLLTPYLRRHGVDPREVYALDLDEGAGVRTLLLTGSFASLAQAEAARDQLPSSVRSPWVRTIGPLQNKLREQQQ